MADADAVTLAKISYWCREKHFRHMGNAAQTGIQKYGNDPILRFYHAYSMIFEDRVQEGMRELEQLKDKADVNVCSVLALIYAHKKAKQVDREAIGDLDIKLKEIRKQAGEKGLYFAGVFLFHIGRYDKSREYIDRVLKANQNSKEGLSMKGWLEYLSGRDANVKKAMKYFDESFAQAGAKDIDALFGKARCYEARRNFSGALELINQAVVNFPSFVPALIEKMRIQLALQDWENTMETAHRILEMDRSCLQAQRYLVLHLLCREGNYQGAADQISALLTDMDRLEPKNHYLYDEFARVFCRLAGRSTVVLQQTYFMEERAVGLDNFSAEYLNELGYQQVMMGKNREAMKCYRNAMKIDETSVKALTGIIRCQLIDDQLDDAAQQLEFLNEIQQSIGQSPELMYLTAVLNIKRLAEPEQIIEMLNKTVEAHFIGIKGQPLGTEYFYLINPDFLIQIVKDYLSFTPQEPTSRGQNPPPVLKRCSAVLDPLTRAMPGLLEGLFLMGKVKYLTGDIDSAQSTLQHCLDQDQTFSAAHILMAEIYLHQNNFKLANQSLEVGLSYNFEVREHPMYHLIKARICKKQTDYDGAVKTLQLAMLLPGVKSAGNEKSFSKDAKKRNFNFVRTSKMTRNSPISLSDRVSVYLELADAHRSLDAQHEAAKVMQDAMNDFAGTPEEVRIMIANADLSLARGDVDGALTMLRTVTPEQAYFVQAREKMADIYLHHRKDKRLYASCYRELVDKHQTSHTMLLLGDAYMNIQEPEKAIEIYDSALKKNTKDGALASKIGQALVKTHNYGKAINYYEAALKQGGPAFLRYDLAELLLKLRQVDKSEKILRQALEKESSATDLDTLIEHTRYYMLLARVYLRKGNLDESMQHLTMARDLQTRVLKRVQVEQPDAVAAQKALAAQICSEMSQQACITRDYDAAIKFYKEALVHNENDGRLMLELAKLYLTTEDLDSCQRQCMALLRSDKENDAATVMMADLMFRKHEYDQAMYHFQQLLERRPDHYEAMARLVDLMRRAGKLEEVPKFLDMAESASGRSSLDAGFNYCQGLYQWYLGNPNNALKYFNKARKDTEWGHKAMYNMIEICLNPDNETIGGEVFETVEQDLGAIAEKADSDQVAIRTAEKLIRELKPKPGDLRGRLLENMALVATKTKPNVEKAISAFMDIASTEQKQAGNHEREHVGALYGMAAAYMVLKQTPRARNQLKRVSKNTWNMEDAEDLERAWLLLSDIYIQSGKYDMATELLRKVLEHNKTSCKAYEYMGYIMEREQSYKDAAFNYEMAWKYGNKTNPNIGYKLSFNYMKAKRFVDAIDICHHVLHMHPNYPKIRKEILEKSRQSLRI